MNAKKMMKTLAPGILAAATGIGAGDLITGGLAGANVGLIALWAPLVGALLKFVLSEGLTRWQIATNLTLLEGWNNKFFKFINYIFFLYLILWSYMVGGALINACSIAGDAIFPLGEHSEIIWGFIHSLVGLILVSKGSFQFFEKIIAILISIMFVGIISFGIMMLPAPSVIQNVENPWPWILGVMGGVGGTLTILSYGYWIKEDRRVGVEGLKTSRIDLAVSYFLTSLFSIAMIIIGSKISVLDKNNYALFIAKGLQSHLGELSYWVFLVGFWAGVFSSMLGVWQSVPYLFSDFLRINKQLKIENLRTTKWYSYYGVFLAIVPLSSLWLKFEKVQLTYAIMGAMFMPLLALSLLILNNQKQLNEFRNTWISNLFLMITIILFSYFGFKGY
jgi:Mn2+/Fe2+ NRAMP family transporter